MNARGEDTGPGPLRVRHGERDWVLDGHRPFTIGRAPTCDLVVAAAVISRMHATILVEDGSWVVRDSGSVNGVHVDGSRLEAFYVGGPMRVTIGTPADGVHIDLEPLPPLGGVLDAVPVARTAAEQPEATVLRADLGRDPTGPWHEMTPRSPDGVARLGAGRLVSGSFATAGGGSATIGRDPACAVVVDDVLVSRVHARVEATPRGTVLTDLGSSNGTFVNGRRVTQVSLAEGDTLTVGNTDLGFVDGVLGVQLPATAAAARVVADGIGLVIGGGKRLLEGIDLELTPGTLTAIVGPSGAGKSTFSRILTGQSEPTEGSVSFDGHDVHRDYELLRSRIGFVPQSDVVHDKLSVDTAMDFAARLRLPDASPAERRDVVDRVLVELELTEHRATRVDRLSGGQRKRVSAAIELITGPELLVLDEPTSGLDPALDLTVMRMLRTLADAGRVVVVVTHSLAYLRECCDNVLLLAPGGRIAYWGAVADLELAYGDRSWADIFAEVTNNPRGAAEAHARRSGGRHAPRPPTSPGTGVTPRARRSVPRQARILIDRQLRLIAADPVLLVFLLALPVALGGLALLVPGSRGFGLAEPNAATEPSQLLVLLVLGACFMGAALSIRDIVAERVIYARERAVGLAPAAYVASKVAVAAAAAAVQSVVLVTILTLGKPAPGHGVLLPSGLVELVVVVWLTAWVSGVLGAAVSASVRSGEQTMPMLVVLVMTQLVMTGGMIPVTGRQGLSQVAALFPSRWGYAAGASTVDLRTVVPIAQPDALWLHTPGRWLTDVGVLVLMLAAFSWVVWWRVRLPRSRRR